MRFVIAMVLLCGCLIPAWSAAATESAGDAALWTIYCHSFSGPTRAQEAKATRDAMIVRSGMHGWYVIHQESESILFYGHYRSTDRSADDPADRKDAQQAHADLKKIQELQDSDQNRLFPLTVFIQTPQPGSEGPPEWDLRKTSADKVWTLYVGVYKDNPERKRACVQAVKALRDAGEEAYYYHDDSASIICLGAWPASAVKQPEQAVASSRDPNEEVWVYNTPLAPKVPREFTTNDGRQVKIYDTTIKILDESLQRTIDLHPDFMTNGVVMAREVKDPRTGEKKLIKHTSQLLAIPRRDRAGSEAPPAAQEGMRQLQPSPHAPSGSGSLKRLED